MRDLHGANGQASRLLALAALLHLAVGAAADRGGFLFAGIALLVLASLLRHQDPRAP